jgi:hypothetical protein
VSRILSAVRRSAQAIANLRALFHAAGVAILRQHFPEHLVEDMRVDPHRRIG